MKRPKLKDSLAKLQKEGAKRAKVAKKKEIASETVKVDQRVVHHQWSDGERTLLPFRCSTRNGLVLIVGEGDFSFSRALHQLLPDLNIIATSLDTRERVLQKYPNSANPFSQELLFGVDATKMSLKSLCKAMGLKELDPIERIVFNFPHTGEGIKDRAYNIRNQQALLLAFFKAAAQILKAQKAFNKPDLLKRKTLMARENSAEKVQSEDEEEIKPRFEGLEPEIHVTVWTGDPYDDWNLRRLATSTDLLELSESFVFDPARYPSYRHCRTVGHVEQDETFALRTARTFVFTLKK